MTVDERIEAIAQTLDTLTKLHLDYHREYSERFDSLARTREESEKRFDSLARTHENFEKTATAIAADMNDAIKRLTNIAEAHDIQIDGHEDRIKKLEE